MTFSPVAAAADASCPACRADFAIYSAGNEGAAILEAKALETFLKKVGMTSEIVTAADLAAGVLQAGPEQRYRGLLSPGGNAKVRTDTLKGAARDNIRNFVSRGGSYVAFCAGAYYAAVDLLWAETNSVPRMNSPTDYQTLHTLNDLGIFTGGVAQGPFGWHPFRSGSRLDSVVINTANPVMKSIGIPREVTLFYANGPFFTVTQPPPGYQVWASAKAPTDAPDNARLGDGKPTVISYEYESGRAILFAYHPVTIPFPRATSTMEQEMNYQSQNLLRAALNLALHRPAGPMPRDIAVTGN